MIGQAPAANLVGCASSPVALPSSATKQVSQMTMRACTPTVLLYMQRVLDTLAGSLRGAKGSSELDEVCICGI